MTNVVCVRVLLRMNPLQIGDDDPIGVSILQQNNPKLHSFASLASEKLSIKSVGAIGSVIAVVVCYFQEGLRFAV